MVLQKAVINALFQNVSRTFQVYGETGVVKSETIMVLIKEAYKNCLHVKSQTNFETVRSVAMFLTETSVHL